MKKLIIASVIAIGALGGGYVMLSQSAQSAAEEAIATIESEIEAGIPNSDFTFGEVKANIFTGTANVSDLAFKVDGATLLTATTLIIAGDNNTLKHANLAGIEGSYEAAGDKVMYKVNSLVLEDVDMAAMKAFIEAARVNPSEAMTLLNSLSIGEFELADMSLKGVVREDREALLLTGNLNISGVNDGAVKSLSVSGSLEDKIGFMNGDTYKGELEKFSMSNLRFADLFEVLILGTPITDQLAQVFGIDDVNIEGLNLIVPDQGITAILGNGSVEIVDGVVKEFSLKGLDFANTNEEFTAKAGEVYFKGLDLSVDFMSETAVTANAAQLFGITDIGIKDASINNAGDEIGIAELSLSDVAIEDGMLVKGKTSIDGLRIPLILISEMDRSAAQIIGDITGAEEFVLSMSYAIDFDTTKGTYDTEIDFGAEDFAKVKLFLGLSGLDVVKVKRASQVTNIFEAIQVWGGMSEDLKMTSLIIEYADDQLANKMLAEIPEINELMMMSEMQIDMFLGQYPEQANQLKAAINGFLEGKNGFKVSATAKTPVALTEMEGLYMSGGLTNSITFEFEGN
jgi:hypothetical protein